MDLKFWKEDTASIQDFEEFYNLAETVVPDERPFCWSNTVGSLDGIIHFLEEDSDSKDVALSSRIDWDLLNYGWSKANAILLNGSENFPAIGNRFREEELQYPQLGEQKFKYPLHVYLTGRGKSLNVLQSQTILNSEVPCAIFTTSDGIKYLNSLFEGVENGIDYLKSKNTITIQLNNFTPNQLPTVDPRDVIRSLRRDFNVTRLEITAGGITIYQFMYFKLIDEIRYTIASHLIGNLNSNNQERTLFFPTTNHPSPNPYSFQPSETPRFNFDRLRIVENTHIILRSKLTYRHEIKL